MKTWYITRRALTEGIEVVKAEAEYSCHTPTGLVKKAGSPGYYYIAKSAFDNLDDAIADAEDQRAKRIASYKRRIKALEKIVFTPTPQQHNTSTGDAG